MTQHTLKRIDDDVGGGGKSTNESTARAVKQSVVNGRMRAHEVSTPATTIRFWKFYYNRKPIDIYYPAPSRTVTTLLQLYRLIYIFV